MREYTGVLHFPEENRVGRSFHPVDHPAYRIRTGIVQHRDPLFFFEGNLVIFVRIAGRGKTKFSNQGGTALLAQNIHCKFSGFFNAGMGVVIPVHTDRQRGRRRRDLHYAVGHATHIPVSILG